MGVIMHYASKLPFVQSLLWAQMIGRSFSTILHSNMRSLPPPRSQQDYHGLAINHLNLLLGNSLEPHPVVFLLFA